VLPKVEAETARIMSKYDDRPTFPFLNFFSSSSASENSWSISEEVMGTELNHLFDEIGDQLGFLSNHLYEDVMKQYIKKLWRDIVMTLEALLLLPATQYSGKQVKLLSKIGDTIKIFLFGDGEMVPMRHFDDLAEYRRLIRLVELYSFPSEELMVKYNSKPEPEILSLLKIRGNPDDASFVALKEEAQWKRARQSSV
jgi:hypothetical protein